MPGHNPVRVPKLSRSIPNKKTHHIAWLYTLAGAPYARPAAAQRPQAPRSPAVHSPLPSSTTHKTRTHKTHWAAAQECTRPQCTQPTRHAQHHLPTAYPWPSITRCQARIMSLVGTTSPTHSRQVAPHAALARAARGQEQPAASSLHFSVGQATWQQDQAGPSCLLPSMTLLTQPRTCHSSKHWHQSWHKPCRTQTTEGTMLLQLPAISDACSHHQPGPPPLSSH